MRNLGILLGCEPLSAGTSTELVGVTLPRLLWDKNVGMGMRVDCRHYESRTYASGEVVRKCAIDLAPDAPWKCPENCPGFEQRRFDVGWSYGSLLEGEEPPDEAEPAGEDVAALLDAAEDIVNNAAPEIIAQVAKDEKKGLFRQKGKGKRRKKK